MPGLPKKYAKLGFAKGWKAFKKSKSAARPAARPAAKKTKARQISQAKTNKQTSRGGTMPAKRKISRGRMMPRGLNVQTLTRNATDFATVAAGMAAGNYLGRMVAKSQPKLQPLAPLAVAMLLMSMFKNELVSKAAVGMGVAGAYGIAKSFAVMPQGTEMLGDLAQFGLAGSITPSDVQQAIEQGKITADQGAALLQAQAQQLGDLAQFGQDDSIMLEDSSMAGDDFYTTEDVI